MDISFKTVVEYVKNLFPGKAPVQMSATPELDAAALYRISDKNVYLKARNGKHYWYCFVYDGNIPLARYLLKINGVNASVHNSRYNRSFYCKSQPVLRVLVSSLNKNPRAKDFVDSVMKKKNTAVPYTAVEERISVLRQKVK